jgi:hypothetical protein
MLNVGKSPISFSPFYFFLSFFKGNSKCLFYNERGCLDDVIDEDDMFSPNERYYYIFNSAALEMDC